MHDDALTIDAEDIDDAGFDIEDDDDLHELDDEFGGDKKVCGDFLTTRNVTVAVYWKKRWRISHGLNFIWEKYLLLIMKNRPFAKSVTYYLLLYLLPITVPVCVL